MAYLADRRLRREAANDLALGTMAARGKEEAVKKQLRQLTEDKP